MKPTALLMLLVSLAPGAFAQDERLERCQYLHSRIDHYTKLRRGGGSAQTMENWRKVYEEEFRELRCYKYGKKLRESN